MSSDEAPSSVAGLHPATGAREFFERLEYVVIAVIDLGSFINEGDDHDDERVRPWAVLVKVQRYQAGAVEWFSKTDTVHSQAIAGNDEVALTAFDADTGYGVFAHAHAKKLLTLPGGYARYRAEIYEAWYTDASRKKTNINIKDL